MSELQSTEANTNRSAESKAQVSLSSQSALVLFSGGQDSTTCLAWALERFERVETVGFDYGQRHSVELICRKEVLGEMKRQFPTWASKLGADHMLDLNILGQISETAMTRNREIEFAASGLPNTFVPARNLLFFSFAAAVAYRRSLKHLIGGMCETDYSGYPDCRDNTLKSLQVSLSLGMDSNIVIDTPLMWLDKAQTWALARELGGEELLSIIVHQTHTCYKGERQTLHPWGYGCNACPACELRSEGYRQFKGVQEEAKNKEVLGKLYMKQ
jgi:7-cyano-7-deazaguanine synthase